MGSEGLYGMTDGASKRVKSIEIAGSKDWSDKHNGGTARTGRVEVTVSLLILGIRRKRSS